MPKVSIIIPTFNRTELLLRAVESARKASSAPVEIVVVDDASTDETARVGPSLNGVKYVRQSENQGMSAARNRGVAISSGEYIVFLDDDDELFPDALEMGVKALDAEPAAGFFYGQVSVRRHDGSMTPALYPNRAPEGDIFWECAAGFLPCPLAMMVRRSAHDAVGGHSGTLRHFEDNDFWTKVSERYECIATMDVVGVYRQSRPGSGQASTLTRLRAETGLAVQARWMKLPRAQAANEAQRVKALARFRDGLADHLIFDARAAVDNGLKGHARANLLAAIRLHPKRALRPWTFKLLWQALI